MSVERYAIINQNSSIVENITNLDLATGWTPHTGYIAVQSDTAGIGQIYTGGTFSTPSPPSPTIDQQKAAIIGQLKGLDQYIPRGLEDTWTAMSFNTSTLPSIQQTRLAQKISLRAQLAAL